jgi:hypothetical protein
MLLYVRTPYLMRDGDGLTVPLTGAEYTDGGTYDGCGAMCGVGEG